jgi:hypothetical protein
MEFAVGIVLAIADSTLLNLGVTLTARHVADPFPAFRDPSLTGIWASGFVAVMPIDGKHLALVAVYRMAVGELVSRYQNKAAFFKGQHGLANVTRERMPSVDALNEFVRLALILA